jgi:hemoglobin
MAETTLSLFERLGGENAMVAAVELFYSKVLADEVTRPFFEGLDMETQTRKQIAFMTWAFGGPSEYRGRDLRTAHGKLLSRGLGDEHFDAVAQHLTETLKELDVGQPLIDEALGIVASTRRDVLGR